MAAADMAIPALETSAANDTPRRRGTWRDMLAPGTPRLADMLSPFATPRARPEDGDIAKWYESVGGDVAESDAIPVEALGRRRSDTLSDLANLALDGKKRNKGRVTN